MIKIGLCGFGYRAHFYLDIAQVTKEFEIVGIYTNDEKEKATIQAEGYLVVENINDFKSLNPLFIVNAISKKANYALTSQLLEAGFYVMQETPYATTLQEIHEKRINSHLQIAEQYNFFPTIRALKRLIIEKVIGEVTEIQISLMHDYHAYSVIRYLLDTTSEAKISGFKYLDYVARTKSRTEEFMDGVVIPTTKKHLILRYENNKRAIYDFNSEEYRSPIRNKGIHILGTRGEIINDWVYYLDVNNNPKAEQIKIERVRNQISKISFGKEILFRETCIYGFNEDTYALYNYLKQMPNFIINKEEVYPNILARSDSLASICMNSVGDGIATS